MVEKASDSGSSKEKKKHSYRMEFKKQVAVYAEANRNRSAALHFHVEPKSVRNGRNTLKKLNLLNLIDNVLMEVEENPLTRI